MKQLNIDTLEITVLEDSGLGEEFSIVHSTNNTQLAWYRSSEMAEKLIDSLERKDYKAPFLKKALMLTYLEGEFDKKGLKFSSWMYISDLDKQGLLKFYGKEFTFHILASTKDRMMHLRKTIVTHTILMGRIDASLYVTKMLEIFKDVEECIERANENYGTAEEIIKTL